MQTEHFVLNYGLEYQDTLHIEGELRLPTLLDMEEALEEAPENSCQARVNRHVWARTITRLGDIPQAHITPDLLATLVDTDFGVLNAAETALRKKRRARSEITA